MAYLLYVEQGLDAKQVSEITGISTNTLSSYNKKEDWEKQRSARRMSPDKLIARYYAESNKVIDKANEDNRALTIGEMDALAKLGATIQKLDKRTDPSIVMSVLIGFNNYLLPIDRELAKQFVPLQMEYVKQLLGAEG